MSEFKFNCPVCGQRTLADTNWEGRRIHCLSCNSRITVPAPGKVSKQVAESGPKARPKQPGRVMRVRLPEKNTKKAKAPAESRAASQKKKSVTKKQEPWL